MSAKYWAGDVSDSDSDYDDAWPRTRPAYANGARPRSKRGGPDRPVIPKLVIHQAGPTVTVSRQTLTPQDLAALATALTDVARMNPGAAPNIVRVALVTELAFALASRGSAGRGGTGSLASSSLDAVRHTADLTLIHEDKLKTALIQVISTVDPGSELPATALVSLGRVGATHGVVAARWAARLPESYDAWQRLQPLLGSVTPAPPCARDSADDLLADLVKAAGLSKATTKPELLTQLASAFACATELQDCRSDKLVLAAQLDKENRQVARLTTELGNCDAAQRVADGGLSTAVGAKLMCEEQLKLIRDILLLTDDAVEQNLPKVLQKRLQVAEHAVEEATENSKRCSETLKNKEKALQAASRQCEDCETKIAKKQAVEDATVLGKLRKLYTEVLGKNAGEEDGAQQLVEAIRTTCLETANRAAQLAASQQRPGEGQSACEGALARADKADNILRELHTTVTASVTNKEQEASTMVDAIVAQFKHDGAAKSAAEHAYSQLLGSVNVFLTGSGTATDNVAGVLEQLRTRLLELADVEDGSAALNDVVNAIGTRLMDQANSTKASEVFATEQTSATRAAVDKAAANASLQTAARHAAKTAEDLAAAVRLAAEARAAKASAADYKAQAEHTLAEVRRLQGTVAVSQNVVNPLADDADGAALRSCVDELAKERSTLADARRALEMQSDDSDFVGAFAKLKPAGVPANAPQNEQEPVHAAEHAKLAHVLESLNIQTTEEEEPIDLLTAYADRMRHSNNTFAEAWLQNQVSTELPVWAIDTMSKMLVTLRVDPADQLDAVWASAKAKLDQLLAQEAPEPDDDGAVAALISRIGDNVNLNPTGRGGEGSDAVKMCLRKVLDFVTGLRTTFAELAKKANVAQSTGWKLELLELQAVLREVPVEPAKIRRRGVTVATQVETFNSTFRDMVTQIDVATQDMDAESWRKADMTTRLRTLISIATGVSRAVDGKQRTDAHANLAVTGQAYTTIAAQWKANSVLLTDIRNLFKGEDNGKVKDNVTKLFIAASGIYDSVRHAAPGGKKPDRVMTVASLLSVLEKVRLDITADFYKGMTPEAQVTALDDQRKKISSLNVLLKERNEALADVKAAAAEDLKLARSATLDAQVSVHDGLVTKAAFLTEALRDQVQHLTQFTSARVSSVLFTKRSASTVALADNFTLASLGPSMMGFGAASNERFSRKVTDLRPLIHGSRPNEIPPQPFAVYGDAAVYSSNVNTEVKRLKQGNGNDDIIISKGGDLVRGFAIDAGGTVVVIRGDVHPHVIITAENGQQWTADPRPPEQPSRTTGLLRTTTTTYGLLGVGFCRVGDGMHSIMLCNGLGLVHGLLVAKEGVKTATCKWTEHLFKPIGLATDVVPRYEVRTCSMAHREDSDMCVGIAVGGISGIDALLHTVKTGDVKYVNMFAGVKVMSADIKSCDKGFVLAFTVARTVHVVTFNSAVVLDGAKVFDVHTIEGVVIRSKVCSDVPGSGALVAVSVKVGTNQCYEGVTVADSQNRCFLPWYELVPLEVFNEVRRTLTDVSGILKAFAELDMQEGAIGKIEEARGGASAHELVAYGTLGQRTFHEPQSSALLLDLLRW